MADNTLAKLSASMADAVEKAGAATVLVNARKRMPATGIAYDAEHILTADHVVQRDEDIKVILADGTELSATVAGRDPGSDLALLKLEKAEATPAETIEGKGRIGQIAIALGRPTSEGVQASFGIVSAQGGPVRTRRGGLLEGHIRTDAIPYPGFSGGPLIDADGKVIGINTSGLGMGNSLAIPADVAWRVAANLKEHGSVKRGFLGVRSQLVEVPADAQKALGREQDSGLLVVGVEDGSPAAEGGLMVSDIIVGLAGEMVDDHDSLMAGLSGEVVGKPTELNVLRGGKPENVTVTVVERKEPKRRHGRRRRAMWRGRRHHGGIDFSHRGSHGPHSAFRFHGKGKRGRHGKAHFWVEHLDDEDTDE
ncbi:MAG: PDZ domain-containing protein [Chloroflexi bacterium]|nr:MAG: PDZ domain-containing protein [Chloroflexota bacterium]MBL1197354.1 PDZ domain-containing protein [Chloroflexota bacterium]NOH14651.1 PDZ domain-containing protein [Chloroflexota bacterium]